MTIVVISGGFDPIHSGHISYINSAAALGEKLVVLLNSDSWLQKKKNKEFMSFSERKIILESIKGVDMVLDFDDDEQGSCIFGLKKVKSMFPNEKITFCNGGDRNNNNIPEMSIKGISFEFGVGGNEKQNSSSWILKNWSYPSEDRIWGTFYNLFESKGLKVKELVVKPNSGMSFQRHFKRNEIWFIAEGSCSVNFSKKNPEEFETLELKKDSTFFINVNDWHQIFNDTEDTCRIIEIQYGDQTTEEDIERLCYYPDTPV